MIKKFKKIRQFKDCLKSIKLEQQYVGHDEEGLPIYDKNVELPTVVFKGTVKIHGSNGSVAYSLDTDELTPQGRNRILTIDHDNFGFACYVKKHEEFYKEFLADVCRKNDIDSVVIFGEWAGQGIQNKVAVSELSKRFIIFDMYNEVKGYMDVKDLDGGDIFHNIYDYTQYSIEVDLRYPALSFDEMMKLTLEVEECCPYGKAHGVDSIGEGIVWKYKEHTLKTKGAKHSGSSGGSKIPSIDPIKAQSVKDFIDQVVTEDRLNQCWDVVSSDNGELTMKNISDLMRWIFTDIMDEEGDALAHNDLCKKDVSGAIANTARPWFINKINQF